MMNKKTKTKLGKLVLGNALFFLAWLWVAYNVIYQFETFQHDKYYWRFVMLMVGIPAFLIVVNIKACRERK